MPKRSRQFDEEHISEHTVKKQISLNNGIKIREIRSLSSERTINMLFKAAAKNISDNEVSLPLQCSCANQDHAENRCNFCDNKICTNCVRACDICDDFFCKNCSFMMYDEQYDCLCYSCVKNK